MLQEGDQRSADTHHLARRHILKVDLRRRRKAKLLIAPARHRLVQKLPACVHQRARLSDREPILLISRQILNFVGDKRHHIHLFNIQLADPLNMVVGDHLVRFNQHLTAVRVDDAVPRRPADQTGVRRRQAALHLVIGSLNKAILVHPAIARQPADQPDIRPFRRLDRADPPIVAVVHIAHLKPRSLAPQAARPQRRKRSLVRQLRQGIRLLHELA